MNVRSPERAVAALIGSNDFMSQERIIVISQQCRIARKKLLKKLRKYKNVYFGINLNQRIYELVCRCFDYNADPASDFPPRNLDAFFAALAWPELVQWCQEQGFSCSMGENGIRIKEIIEDSS